MTQKKRVGPTERLSPSEVKQFYSMQPTERDFELCEFIRQCGGATTEQLKKGFFPGNWTTCTRRLQKLFQNSFLWRFWIDPYTLGFDEGQETLFHVLDVEGANLVAQRWGVPVESVWQPSDKKVSQQSLKHLLPTVDILVSFRLAAAAMGGSIKNLETDHTWRKKPIEQRLRVDYMAVYGDQESYESGVMIIPDASFTLVTPEREYQFVLEYDTGSEVKQLSKKPRAGAKDSSLKNKARRYISLLHKKKRTEPSIFERITNLDQRGIRILFVTTANENRLFETIKSVGGKNTYWIARSSLVTP